MKYTNYFWIFFVFDFLYLYLHMALRGWNLGFKSIQIPSETGSGLLTLRADAQKNCLNDAVLFV